MEEALTTRYLPGSVRTYLGSEEVTNINLDIKKKYNLQEKDLDALYDITWDVIEGRIAPRDMVYEIKSRVKWQEKKIVEIALQVLGRKLLPLSNFIPGIPETIKELGGDPGKYPAKKVTPEQVTLEQFVNSLMKDLNVILSDKFLKHRLENAVVSKINGVRDDFEVKNRMVRGVKIGGLDIAPSQADQIIQYIDSAKGIVQVVEKTAPAPAAPGSPAPAAVPTAEPVSEEIVKKETGTSEPYTVRLEDIEEIAKEKEREISSTMLAEFSRIEKEILKESSLRFDDPDKQNKFENIVQARVRDVRDELETKNFLTRGPREGGLGLPKEKADALIMLINEKSRPLWQRLTQIGKQEKQGHLQKIKQQKEHVQAREQEELDTRYAAMTGRTPAAMPEEKPAKAELSLPLEEEKIIPSYKKELEKRLAVKRLEPPEEAAPVPTKKELEIPIQPIAKKPAPAPAPMPQRPVAPAPIPVKKPVTLPVPPPIPAVPRAPAPTPPAYAPTQPRDFGQGRAKPKVRISPPSAPAPLKPKVEEIKYTKRLFGPVEELRAMKLEDFRRLSKDADEASLKIKDKIDLLEEESFDKKMKGTAAWQESPCMHQYLNLIQAAFQTGKNVQTIVSERQQQRRETLTWNEFQAILKLNQSLKI